MADRPPFTVGLERDLSDLQSVSDSDIANSSLGILLGKSGPRVAGDALLLEPAPLNAEQRQAVVQGSQRAADGGDRPAGDRQSRRW